MVEKFNNKYRIPSARLQCWDYGANADYFVTICTYNRAHLFGEIIDGAMQLNQIGVTAQRYWLEIPNHFPFVKLDAHIIMPNHIHGILTIDRSNTPTVGVASVETTYRASLSEKDTPVERFKQTPGWKTPKLGVSTIANITNPQNDKKWKPGTLGVIINQYKRIVTIDARKIDPKFQWQTRFHDHIIRTQQSFQLIQEYIHENPLRWVDDMFYL